MSSLAFARATAPRMCVQTRFPTSQELLGLHGSRGGRPGLAGRSATCWPRVREQPTGVGGGDQTSLVTYCLVCCDSTARPACKENRNTSRNAPHLSTPLQRAMCDPFLTTECGVVGVYVRVWRRPVVVHLGVSVFFWCCTLNSWESDIIILLVGF